MKTPILSFGLIRENDSQVRISPFIKDREQNYLRDFFSACARAFYFWTRR